jgi:hypothetical protein
MKLRIISEALFIAQLSGLLFFFYHSAFAFMGGVDETEAEEVNVETSIEFSSTSDSQEIINFSIIEDIARAKALLENERCDFQIIKSKRTRKKGKNELGDFAILLAIENLKSRDIRVIRIHPKLGAKSDGIVVERGKSNGVNTNFTIVYPEHHVVLAIKRPARHGSTFKAAVYTPYTEALDIAELRNAGLDYLKQTLRAAKEDLIAKKVMPLSGDQFLPDNFSLALAIIEHIDPLKFESGRYAPEKLINETLVILGANKQDAYRFSASKAGARGLFQFIPSTYERIVRLYPQAGLHKDFAQGMEDHVNAAKASFLLFDADMRVLEDGKKVELISDPHGLGRFIASAYNCGSGKTKVTMDRYGQNWTARVPAETRIYLRKFASAWKWLHDRLQKVR